MDAQSKKYYDLIEADTTTTDDTIAFIEAVNQKIVEGWEPLGAPVTTTGVRPTGHYRRMCQAMTLRQKLFVPEVSAAGSAEVSSKSDPKPSNAQKGKQSNEQRSNA